MVMVWGVGALSMEVAPLISKYIKKGMDPILLPSLPDNLFWESDAAHHVKVGGCILVDVLTGLSMMITHAALSVTRG